MAINKRKVLDAARKFAQKGAKQKALKEYNQLIQLDPRDAKLLLEVGDAYRRWGQLEEAISQYTKVAAQYKQDGFDARAVAVFKQILNLDPKRYTAYVSLSELYQRMGLDGEAIGALQTAADGYHKEGRKREALELLRRMAALDPSNTTNRMKVADLLRQEGMEQDAVSEYEEVLAELRRQGASEQTVPVYERLLEIQPKRVDMLVALASHLCESARPELAEPFARRALEAAAEPEHYELLCNIYRSLGDDQRLAQTTRELAKLYRQRGDEDRARDILQRLPGDEAIDAGGLALDPQDGASAAQGDTPEAGGLADEGILEDEFVLDDEGGLELSSGEDEIELEETIGAAAGKPEPRETQADEPQPEGDPDQLFAEASVYLRYGKREQALASLEAILLQEPEHRGALEKLGEVHAEAGDRAAAVGFWQRTAEVARREGDAAAFAIVRDRIAALDPAAASALEPLDASDSDEADEGEAAGAAPAEDGFELDLSVDSEPAAQVDSSEISAVDPEADADAEDFSFDVDVEIDLGTAAAEADETGSTSGEMDPALAEDSHGIEIDTSEFDVDGVDTTESGGEEVPEPASSPSSAGQSTASAARIQEELEEADFYVQQGLSDEAEAVYRRILATAPNHPAALLRLGELAAARGEDPSSAGLSLDGDDAATTLEEKRPLRAAAPVSVETQESPQDRAEEESEEESEEKSEEESDADATGGLDLGASLAQDLADETAADSGRQADDTLPLSAREDDASFDLAAELAGSFDESAEAAAAPALPSPRSTVADGFESIFADFKKGVSATLDAGDFETRYDLGIAYREMGLFEDAIGEFRICLECPSRRFDSLCMMGLCAFDLGRFPDAVSHLEQALSSGDLPAAQQAGVTFDLGRAYGAAGDLARARNAYARVGELSPGFPGLDEAVAALRARDDGATPGGEPPQELESFGDLMAEMDAEGGGAEESAPETFENFDDVITDAEAAYSEATPMACELEPEVEAAEIVAEEPERDPVVRPPTAAGSTGPEGRKPPRKKRISFV